MNEPFGDDVFTFLDRSNLDSVEEVTISDNQSDEFPVRITAYNHDHDKFEMVLDVEQTARMASLLIAVLAKHAKGVTEAAPCSSS